MAEKKWRKRGLGNRALAPETLMMGFGFDPMLSEGSLKPPLFQTSTFVFPSAQAGKDFFATMQGRRKLGPDEEPGLVYSRFNNPNLEVLEDRLALWDEAEASLAFASGMAAISTCLWAYLRPGDVVLQSQPIYGGTETLIHSILPEFGVRQVGFEVEGGVAAMRAAARDAQAAGRVAAIYIETPANPTNGLVDIAEARRISDALATDGKRPPVIVDNTMLGPIYCTPLAHGADLVVTSLTKYVGGHSDLIGGGASGTKAMLAPVRRMRSTLGTMCDPHTAWLLLRSLETLKLRMTASAAGARKVAEFLRGHGYPARAQTNADSDVLQIPLILWAGLGELSRIGELVLNPFVGPRFKSVVLTTDLPLEVDRPIDFGLQKFCGHCMKCARECPCDAIPFGDKVMFNGYEMWKPDVERCTRYRVTNPHGSACGRCMKTCPYNHEGLLAHRLFLWAAIHLPWARGWIVRFDDRIGNGSINPAKTWWTDLEIVDGKVVAPRGTNRRELAPGKPVKAQEIAYYPAAAMPQANAKDAMPVDRKAALAVRLETPAAARARRF